MKKILSLGVGVNSTAMLILGAHGKIDFDVAVFSDTGSEQPETYAYWNDVIINFCLKHDIELVRVQSKKYPLHEFYYSKNIIPTRMYRHCSDHFKKVPQKKYALKKFPNDNVQFILGISSDETRRAKECDESLYPLVEMGIDRKQCFRIIKDEGLPFPVKSGCWCCPFAPKKARLALLRDHPDLFDKAIELEENNMRFPELTLYHKPLRQLASEYLKILKAEKEQSTLCDVMESCSVCEIETNEF